MIEYSARQFPKAPASFVPAIEDRRSVLSNTTEIMGMQEDGSTSNGLDNLASAHRCGVFATQ
jgi:hypothetical protein